MLVCGLLVFLLLRGNEFSVEPTKEFPAEDKEISTSEPEVPSSVSTTSNKKTAKTSVVRNQRSLQQKTQTTFSGLLKDNKSIGIESASYRPPEHLVRIEIKGGYAIAFGDVLLGQVKQDVPKGKKLFLAKNPLEVKLWPTPVIPYLVSEDVPNKDAIYKALEEFHSKTSLRFIQRTKEQDYLFFKKGDEHCYSFLGKVGGKQPIILSAGCGASQVVHEIMHALGFIHEHSRFDRDEYVKVNWEKITPGFYHQFDRMPRSTHRFYDEERIPFDYKSVMLYSKTAFANTKGDVTLESLKGDLINPQGSLGLLDIEKVELLYKSF